MVWDDAEKGRTAIHEAGHALAAYYTEYTNDIDKVTILPWGTTTGNVSHYDDCRALKNNDFYQSSLVFFFGWWGGFSGRDHSARFMPAGVFLPVISPGE